MSRPIKPRMRISTDYLNVTNDESSIIKLSRSNKYINVISFLRNLFQFYGIRFNDNELIPIEISAPSNSHAERVLQFTTRITLKLRYIPLFELDKETQKFELIAKEMILILVQCLMFINFIRFGYLLSLMAKEDRIWKLVNPRNMQNVTNCQRFYSSIQDDSDLDYYVRLRDEMVQVGGNFYLEPVSLLSYSAAIVFGLGFWLVNAYLISKRGFVIDFLNFMIDPIYERNKTEAELLNLSSTLANSIKRMDRKLPKSAHSNRTAHPLSHLSNMRPRLLSTNTRATYTSDFDRLNLDENLNFVLSLNNVIKLRLVKPSNQTYHWLKHLNDTFNVCKYIIMVTMICWPIFSIYSAFAGHIYEDAKLRIQWAQCFEIAKNRTVYLDLLGCDRNTEMTEDELNSYKQESLDDTRGIIRLIFKYNLRRCIRIENWSKLIQVLVMMAYFSAITVLGFFIYMVGFRDKTYWLDQIERQIDASCSSIQSLNYKQLEETEFKHIKTSRSSQDIILTQILVAYLNYSLFRKRNANFKEFNNNFSIELSTASILIFGLTYHTGVYSQKSFSIFVISSIISVVMSINFVTLIPSIYFNKIIKLRKRIGLLVQAGQSSRLNLQIPMSLWRNQLLEESELVSLFGQRSFFGHVTYKRIITLNAYMMAAWIVSLKFE